MQAVIDTNVWISGIFWSGKPHQVIERFHSGKITPCFSQITWGEWQEKVKSMFIKTDQLELYTMYEKRLKRTAVFVQPRQEIKICRDPDDNRLLEVAVEAHVEYLITGDKDLLELKKFENVRITTPSQFLNTKL